ncbi:putative arrestin domain-containing protein [Rosellinia necatrix]|uniref:Putative arrestin domain-containing protein n=1 Tax=Rosellinia necatrix TaxID=77044 RepID=A0A1W2TKR8_ROSNE|nr:putative arrestin domain-containing protein [Rosellinia necatrix]
MRLADWNRPRRADQSLTRPSGGNVFYSPGGEERRSCHTGLSFPSPQIQPRERRPQSIHITSYPSGYIPDEVRAELAKCRRAGKAKTKKNKNNETAVRATNEEEGSHYRSSRRVFEKVLAPFKSTTTQPNGVDILPATSVPQTPTETGDVRPHRERPLSMISIPPPGTALAAGAAAPEARRMSTMGSAFQNAHRNSMMSVRSAKNIMSSVTEVPKPVASGSGVQCSIILAEPNLFLTGFDHDGHPHHETDNSTALLRGKLQLNITKKVKLKSVTLKLHGKARTEWPEGIPPMKIEQHEEVSLRTQVLTFFHAIHETWETEFGNQCTYTLRQCAEPTNRSLSMPTSSTISSVLRRGGATNNLSPQDYKRLSLKSVQSRSFGKGDWPGAEAAQPRAYKSFYPGKYEYSFELPIDHHQLETTRLQFGSVKWELEAVVERAGAFKPNLHGSKEVRIVRVPDQLSLEMTEPISISRQWEDQLHYDIMISGKSFPIGAQIPIAFKLTPLAKVQVHKIKVFVTESVEYWTADRRVTRKDPGRKILIFEKAAGKPLDKQFETSEIRILSGGELSPDQRHEARAHAQKRRGLTAAMNQTVPEPLPEPSANMLGDLDLGLESFWGPTEMEMHVQIPTCEQMAKNKNIRLHPDCSWKNVNVHHWIKIVMRISRLDPDDPAGKKRRHFEISIDSPFTVLDCRATQANTALPEYSGLDRPIYHQQARCGCPDAEIIATNPSPASSTGSIPSMELGANLTNIESPSITRPPAAHIQQHPAASSQLVQRPMHLLRYPSHNPPAFDADEPPPPLFTPPPRYELVVGTPSVDGLADYFARLADYDGDSDSGDEEACTRSRLTERTGRVNVPHPRTPGGRLVPSRSLEIQRPPVPDTFQIAGALQQRRG